MSENTGLEEAWTLTFAGEAKERLIAILEDWAESVMVVNVDGQDVGLLGVIYGEDGPTLSVMDFDAEADTYSPERTLLLSEIDHIHLY